MHDEHRMTEYDDLGVDGVPSERVFTVIGRYASSRDVEISQLHVPADWDIHYAALVHMADRDPFDYEVEAIIPGHVPPVVTPESLSDYVGSRFGD